MAYRNITYRLIPGSRAKARTLAQCAGACRRVWNHFLEENQKQYTAFKEGRGERPSLRTFSLFTQFAELRRETPWLQELPFQAVREVLRQQASAWQMTFGGAGFPKFKAKGRGDSVTFPSGSFHVRDGTVNFHKIGRMAIRRRGGDPYGECPVVKVVVRRVCGKWYAVLCHRVPDDLVATADNGRAIGLDMNIGQVATSEGEFIHSPDLRRLEARRRRLQRRMQRQEPASGRRAATLLRLKKTYRKISNAKKNWQHSTSRRLADAAGTICIEDLKIKNLTKSAKGTVENPGTNVRAKARLSHLIFQTGWGGLRQKLEYKAHCVIAVNPAYTSQTCRACGHVSRENRKKAGLNFKCVQCGHEADADVNAALNILALGTGAAGRGEAFPPGTSMKRQRICDPHPRQVAAQDGRDGI